ncbi:creatininase family protein [Nitrososphaera sp.]|uniref:creatininase family protein n=1 Tax=Nitrososphaera sp. TaxID=1971748 RepID=UPI00307FCD57
MSKSNAVAAVASAHHAGRNNNSSNGASRRAVVVADMRDPQIRFRRAIIPVGSLEQHGPHLPVSTDTLVVEHIANLVAPMVGAVVMPAIAYGVSYEHGPLFNASVRNSTLSATVCDLCASLADCGFSEIILLNGHHGNMGALQYVAQDLESRIPGAVAVHTLHYWHAMKSEFDHAGEVETSLVLAIAPGLVRMDLAQPNSKKLSKSKAAYATLTNAPGSFIRITGNGVWGDPAAASAEKGKKLIKEITANLAATISELVR